MQKLDVAKKEKKVDQTIRHVVYGSSTYARSKPIRYVESQVTSNLLLQKFLYFNTYFSFMYFYIVLCVQVFRVWVLQLSIFSFVRIIIIVLWGIIEYFRINNGYEGNIREQFPELFAFVMLSIMNLALQVVPLVLAQTFPVEIALGIMMCVFSAFELILSLMEIIYVERSKIALLSQRAAPNNREYIMKKQLDHLRNEMKLNMKNKKKNDDDGQQEAYNQFE